METQADLEKVDYDFQNELDNWELTSEACPDVSCGGMLMIRYFANGADDYYKALKCNTCDFKEQE